MNEKHSVVYYYKTIICSTFCIMKSRHFNEFIDFDGIIKSDQNVHNLQLK